MELIYVDPWEWIKNSIRTKNCRILYNIQFQVLVSFNLEDDIMFTPMVVSRLMQEIKENPDKF